MHPCTQCELLRLRLIFEVVAALFVPSWLVSILDLLDDYICLMLLQRVECLSYAVSQELWKCHGAQRAVLIIVQHGTVCRFC